MTSNGKLKFVVPGDFPPQIQGSAHLERLAPYGEVTMYADRPASMDEQMRRVKGAHVILNTRGAVNWFRDSLERLPDLQMIATCSIGTDNIDLDAASERGVVVSNQPGKIAPYVAEHLIGLLFAVAKHATYQTQEIRSGRWAPLANTYLRGKTLGVIGTGNVGAEVARIANALGMKVLAWTFNPSPERARNLGVEFVELDDLLRQSDAVSIQVRLSDDSRGMLGKREFGLMKPGALFVNGGRGDLVDTDALVEALNSGHLGGAGLDVFDPEPPPADHPLLACEQVVFTPHIADQTPEGIESLNEGIVSNVIAFLEGQPQNVANP
jgi:D-3-phosphoglycerate dehydrogenase